MRDLNVRSLRQLRRRKYFVKRRLNELENNFQEDFYELTHPFAGRGEERLYSSCNEDTAYRGGFSKIVANAMRIGEIARLSFSVIRDFRKR